MEPQPPEADARRERIVGIFSTSTPIKIGAGTTARKTSQKSFWYAAEREDGVIEMQPLNANYVPTGKKRVIDRDKLLDEFAPEPEFYVSTVYPRMRELTKTVARADRLRTKGETFSAEYEYGKALKIDEENIRANFGIGLTYLARGDKQKAEDVFDRLIRLEAAFEEEHKHLFNDFGIGMRKQGLLDQAVQYYRRALELTQDDENLHYNIARAFHEQGDEGGAREHLRLALKIAPDFQEALDFLRVLDRRRGSALSRK